MFKYKGQIINQLVYSFCVLNFIIIRTICAESLETIENFQNVSETHFGNCTFNYLFENQTKVRLRCFGDTPNSMQINEKLINQTELMVLYGWPLEVFDPVTELKHFHRLKTLKIEYGNFDKIIIDFPDMYYLQIINISWTNLSHVGMRVFKKIHALKILDLRLNQLKQLDGSFVLPGHFEKLYLANNPWNCTKNFKWLLQTEKGALVADRDQIMCADRKYKDRNMMIVMNYKVILRNQCQSHPDLLNCSCLMHHILPKSHQPLYTVNCSNLQFVRFPSFLPENTSTLYLNDNQIKDISPLRNNPHYRYVVDIHLMNNAIEIIDELEGSYWLEHFRLLNLQNNKLKKLPVYAIINALEINENANLLLLGGNPWRCSCKFAMRFHDMLKKYHDLIRDAWNISCEFVIANKIQHTKLLAISRHDVCDLPDEPSIYTLDLINAILTTCIIFVLAKLAFDYYQYKYYGRVPWIVMKLP